jgi:type IV fimbrial biogenesis protein FimT
MYLTLRRGFSLIELMVTLTLLALLLSAAIPSFGNWIANARVRTVAEEIQNGIRLAQSEAVRRNRQTVFALTNAAPALAATPVEDGSNWFVRALPLASTGESADQTFYVQGGTFAQQGGVTIDGPALICFNSVGRQVANASTGLGEDCAPADPTVYDITRTGGDRTLRVEVFLGGRVRMCDMARSIATAPDGCTP